MGKRVLVFLLVLLGACNPDVFVEDFLPDIPEVVFVDGKAHVDIPVDGFEVGVDSYSSESLMFVQYAVLAFSKDYKFSVSWSYHAVDIMVYKNTGKPMHRELVIRKNGVVKTIPFTLPVVPESK
jgi:hypothetical protein